MTAATAEAPADVSADVLAEVSGLSIAYRSGARDVPVLRDVSLSLRAGEALAVVGESGCGKSTLASALVGHLRAGSRVTGGAVRIAGEDILAGDARTVRMLRRRRIGFVPQNAGHALTPSLRVGAQVVEVLRAAREMDRTTARAEAVRLLARVRLPEPEVLADRYPHQLSGGPQQRVALARALAPNPALVLLDEPFSSLDAGLRASVRADVRGILRDFRMTAILVTHDQDEALSMADQVVVLRDGVVVQRAAPQDLYDNPADQSLARFVGDANLVVGVLAGEKVRSVLGTLPTRAVGGLDDGARVTALVRPEQIRVLPEGAGDLAGSVASCEYFGHDTLLSITPDSDGAEPLLVRTGFEGSLPVGARVSLAVDGAVTVWAA